MALIDRQRLQKGIAASTLVVFVRILLQFLQVPILYANWPAGQASAWLLIWTLPSYMVLTVGAFSGAGGNMAVAAALDQEIEDGRAIFRATRLAIGASAGVLVPIVIGSFMVLIDLTEWGLDRTDSVLTLLFMSAYVAALILGSGLQVVYRYGGDYAGFGYFDLICAAGEMVTVLVMVSLVETIWLLPAALFVLRVVAVSILSMRARRRWPEMFAPSEPARVKAAFKGMLVPFAGFMAVPLLVAININGYAMLISDMFGPALFAMFLTVRTLVRLADSGVNLGYALFANELSYSAREADIGALFRLLSGLAFFALCATAIYTGLLLLFGREFQQIWTTGKVAYDADLVLIFGACVMLRAVSIPFAALLTSRNAHTAPNFVYLAASVAAFAIAYVSAHYGASMVVVAAWQIGAEAALLVCMCIYSARHFQRRPGGFIADVCRSGPMAAWQIGRTALKISKG